MGEYGCCQSDIGGRLRSELSRRQGDELRIIIFSGIREADTRNNFNPTPFSNAVTSLVPRNFSF